MRAKEQSTLLEEGGLSREGVEPPASPQGSGPDCALEAQSGTVRSEALGGVGLGVAGRVWRMGFACFLRLGSGGSARSRLRSSAPQTIWM